MSIILSLVFPTNRTTSARKAQPAARASVFAWPRSYAFCAAALLCAGAASGAAPTSEPAASTPPVVAVAVVAGRGVDHNFLTLPKAIASGPDWERSTFGAVSVSRAYGTLGSASDLLARTPLKSVLHAVEAVLVKHQGLQHQAEAGAAYTLKTPFLHLGPVALNAGAGIGLSHAFGTPSYEDGPRDDPAARYRTQLLILVDTEWKLANARNWSMLMRVHHRSGAYGLIAPPKVGSNFLAIGLRYTM